MATFSVESAMKSAQWERAKGELRACVAMSGSHHTGTPPGQKAFETERWEKFERAVKQFIKQVEIDGLAE